MRRRPFEVVKLTDTDYHPGLVAVRDSKDPDGPKLLFTPAEWGAFLDSVKA